MICVFMNTVMLTLDGTVNKEGEYIINQFNSIFTIIFSIDSVGKLIGMGFKEFLIDRMNIFDFVISMLSFGELIFLDGGGSALSAFRSIRMLRVTRLIRSLQYMRIIMVVMVSSIKYFIYIFLLLLLFMYIYTLLVIFFIIIKQGKELYATSLVFSDSRFNFSNFYLSLMSTFQILTLENWNDLLTLAL